MLMNSCQLAFQESKCTHVCVCVFHPCACWLTVSFLLMSKLKIKQQRYILALHIFILPIMLWPQRQHSDLICSVNKFPIIFSSHGSQQSKNTLSTTMPWPINLYGRNSFTVAYRRTEYAQDCPRRDLWFHTMALIFTVVC